MIPVLTDFIFSSPNYSESSLPSDSGIENPSAGNVVLALICGILSPFVLAIGNIIDKVLVDTRVKYTLGYIAYTGIVLIGFGGIEMAIADWPDIPNKVTYIFPVLAGLSDGVYFYLYFYSLKRCDASIVIGVMYLYPVVVLILTEIVLHDKITYLAYLGIALLLGGAISLSIDLIRIIVHRCCPTSSLLIRKTNAMDVERRRRRHHEDKVKGIHRHKKDKDKTNPEEKKGIKYVLFGTLGAMGLYRKAQRKRHKQELQHDQTFARGDMYGGMLNLSTNSTMTDTLSPRSSLDSSYMSETISRDSSRGFSSDPFVNQRDSSVDVSPDPRRERLDSFDGDMTVTTSEDSESRSPSAKPRFRWKRDDSTSHAKRRKKDEVDATASSNDSGDDEFEDIEVVDMGNGLPSKNQQKAKEKSSDSSPEKEKKDKEDKGDKEDQEDKEDKKDREMQDESDDEEEKEKKAKDKDPKKKAVERGRGRERKVSKHEETVSSSSSDEDEDEEEKAERKKKKPAVVVTTLSEYAAQNAKTRDEQKAEEGEKKEGRRSSSGKRRKHIRNQSSSVNRPSGLRENDVVTYPESDGENDSGLSISDEADSSSEQQSESESEARSESEAPSETEKGKPNKHEHKHHHDEDDDDDDDGGICGCKKCCGKEEAVEIEMTDASGAETKKEKKTDSPVKRRIMLGGALLGIVLSVGFYEFSLALATEGGMNQFAISGLDIVSQGFSMVAILIFDKKARKHFPTEVKHNWHMGIVSMFLTIVSQLLLLLALRSLSAPVASSLCALQPLFVLVFERITRLSEDTTKQCLAFKVTPMMVIVGGVVAISLDSLLVSSDTSSSI